MRGCKRRDRKEVESETFRKTGENSSVIMSATEEGGGQSRDQIIDIIGNIGKWQWLIILPLAIREIFTSWQMLSPPFLALEPTNYFCNEAGMEKFESLETWQSFANVIKDDGSIDKCLIYDLNYTGYEIVEGIQNASELTNKTRQCQLWKFLEDETPTLVTELICGRSWYITTAQVVYMFGVMCGVFISGLTSDYFGRRQTVLIFTVILTLSSLGAAFSPNMETFIALRWIIAASAVAVWTTGYVYSMEIIGGDWKTWLGIGLMFPWAIGYSFLPLLAYFVPNWFHLQIALTIPLPIFIILYWFLPECPRWLLTKGKVNEAYEILVKAARINGKELPQDLQLKAINQIVQEEDVENEPSRSESTAAATFLDLFKTPNLRRNTLIQYFNWFTVVLVYYGLTLNADTLIPGNVYINFAVGGLSEIPAYIICLIVLHYFGRRIPLAIMYFSSSVLLLVTIGISDIPIAMLVVVSLGKLGIIGVFGIIYLHAAEIFPTVLRSTGLGTSSICGRIGSMLAPIVGRELGKISPMATIVLFAILSCVAGVLTLWLPETKGVKMADTIAEGEALGKKK